MIDLATDGDNGEGFVADEVAPTTVVRNVFGATAFDCFEDCVEDVFEGFAIDAGGVRGS